MPDGRARHLDRVDPVTAVQDKTAQRARARSARRSVPAAERVAASSAIVGRLADQLPDPGTVPGLVASYVAIRDEPDLGELNRRLLAERRLALPRIDDGMLVMVAVEPGTPFVTSSFGVPEPEGPPIEPAAMAVVVVPGLAFDPAGRRMGYGAGYYDRYLAGLPDASLIGVCFEASVVDEVVTEVHDVPVHRVVTEAAVRGPGS